MSTELSSAKYLSDAHTQPFAENPIPVAAEAAPTFAPSPYSAPAAFGQKSRAQWTAMLSLITMFLGVAGFFGVLGGGFGALGQIAITNSDSIQQSAFKGRQGKDAVILQRTLANREKFSTVILAHNGVCVLVGLGFLASCILLAIRKTDANSFASTMCMAAIFYNGLTMVVTCLLLPSFENLPGMPEGGATIAWTVAVGFTGLACLFKVGFYFFVMNYMSKDHIKRVFAPKASPTQFA